VCDVYISIMKRPWPIGVLSQQKNKNNVRKGNYFIIQYNLKPLICPTIYVTFGKLMAVQSVTSAYQKTAGL